jgi:CBS domain-containing protein
MIEKLASTPIKSLEWRPVVRLRPDTLVSDAVDQLLAGHRGAAVVEAPDGRLLGVFTEGDLLAHAAPGAPDWLEHPVGDFATVEPEVIGESESIAEAVSRMKERHFHHLPVLDRQRKVVALISIRDVLAYVVDFFPQEILNLPPDPTRQATSRWGG